MLQDARKASGLSQSQLAEQSGVNVRMIQYYEQGVRDIDGVKLSTLADLAMVLKCPISDIVSSDLKDKLKKVAL